MGHAWLVEVLSDVEKYAIANEMDWLVLLVNKVNIAAKRELARSQKHSAEWIGQVCEASDTKRRTDLVLTLTPNPEASVRQEIPEELDSTRNFTTPNAAYYFLSRMAADVDETARRRLIWRLTPTALTQISMLPDGRGRFIGDQIFRDKAHPSLFGFPVERATSRSNLECRCALVDTSSNEEIWYYFTSVRPVAVSTYMHDEPDFPLYAER